MTKILIDIPDETYEYVKQNYRYGIGAETACKLEFAVAEGTLLPKGHGRLKDENEIKQMIEDARVKTESSKNFAENIIRFAHTIIEADKEDINENN